MKELRPFMLEATRYDTAEFLSDWMWLIPSTDTPLFITVFCDWVFGNPDGSLWVLSLLEGNYCRVASNAVEYNTLKKSPDWLDQTFIASWQSIAAAHGMEPNEDQCLGWRLHPMLGGKFDVDNLQLFFMTVYQSLMGQLHQKFRQA